MEKKKKILLVGGGTGGSVTPLLAIAEFSVFKHWENRADFLFLGTERGPERGMAEKAGLEFKWIYSGKLRRYFSWRNFIDPIFILIGFFQSFFILLNWRPDLIISAGSFLAVPIVWTAWILRVPVIIHQQDICPGLANRLSQPFARIITVAFEKSLNDYGAKAVWIGNPVRQSLKSADPNLRIKNSFNLTGNLPVILIMGGGTGAVFINELVKNSKGELLKFCQIVHIGGKDRILNSQTGLQASGLEILNYRRFEFLQIDKMAEAYALADIVVSRSGMGSLTELSYLSKPSVLIPIPDSHQEANAEIFRQKKAALVMNQKGLTAAVFTDEIKKLIENKDLQRELKKNISRAMKSDANKIMEKIIIDNLGATGF
jgi:UDP-N-acetylglucosamine--N-acetylmuramyl-(pentapeptide) pyrophosphoryl-undecaprenol N-acetylglucosamine transferase